MDYSTGQGTSSNARHITTNPNRVHGFGVLTTSGQKKQGDQLLDETNTLVKQYGSEMSSTDRTLIGEKMIHAREVMSGADSKSHVPGSGYRKARGYRKAAGDAYQYAKTASQRVKDAAPAGYRPNPQPLSGTTLDHVISVARSLYRCNLACKDAFPSSKKSADWATAVWNDACARTGTYPCPSSQPELFTVSSMHLIAEMKTNIMHEVKTLYGFDTSQAPYSISNNTNLAYAMLTRMTFIYRDYNHDGARLPYRHPIIQKAINITWFKDRNADGIVFHEYFSTMPISAITLVLTVIECCIDEWSLGTHNQTSWDQGRFYNTYLRHTKSLTAFSQHIHSQGQLQQIQQDLFNGACQHSGTTADPVTALGGFPPENLDPRQYDTPPPYPDPQ